MLELYTAATPNGKKVPILLAELGVPWRIRRVDLKEGEQKTSRFLALNPNGKIPALVDTRSDGALVVVFESGAILQYVAEGEGKFLPPISAPQARAEVLSWLFWQVGGPGPFFGQAFAFGNEKPRNEAAYAKFLGESKRLASVLDARLKDRAYVAGEYSIADMACYPWFETIGSVQPAVLEGHANVRAWMERVGARPAVKKGMALEGAENA